MEMILDLAVVIAVIIFGGLISVGNERQRKAIDGLREQIVLWAMQDLRIKRERLAREVQVDYPLGWLNRIVSKATGSNLNLQVIEAFNQPQALLCASSDGDEKIIFSPFSPTQVLQLKRNRHSRLAQFAEQNPLFSLSRSAVAYEISVLNNGILFDLELPLAWNKLTGQNLVHLERIWLYRL